MADRQLEMFQKDLLSVAGASDSYKVSQDQVLYQKALKQKHVGAVVNAAATITDVVVVVVVVLRRSSPEP